MTDDPVAMPEHNSSFQHRLLDAINRAQKDFIADADIRNAFDRLLSDFLALTESEYGFIGEVLFTAEGLPYLKTFAITNVAWNEATRNFYETNAPAGLEFFNLKTLFGAALTVSTWEGSSPQLQLAAFSVLD